MEYFFYAFSLLVIFFASFAVFSRNPVHAVLSLIAAFLGSAIVFILFSAEFMAMVLAIVYVGAIAVLFLFVVMMLKINHVKNALLRKVDVIARLSIAFLLLSSIMIMVYYSNLQIDSSRQSFVIDVSVMAKAIYGDYLVLFELCGVILLFAMVGAIFLTISRRKDVKRQNIYSQVARDSSINLVKVEPGKGVNLDD